jgi:hypothetical protein
MAALALIGVVVVVGFKYLILPESYSTSAAGQIGFLAVLLGIVLTAGVSVFATNVGAGAGDVARIGSPVVPALYTALAACLWILSPLLFPSLAKGLHLLLLCACLFGMVVWTFASAAIEAEDSSQEAKGAGRDGIMVAAKGAERNIGEASGPIKKAFSGLMDDVNYADRNGSGETASLESEIVTGFEALNFGGEEAAVLTAMEALKNQIAERRDVLKAGK